MFTEALFTFIAALLDITFFFLLPSTSWEPEVCISSLIEWEKQQTTVFFVSLLLLLPEPHLKVHLLEVKMSQESFILFDNLMSLKYNDGCTKSEKALFRPFLEVDSDFFYYSHYLCLGTKKIHHTIDEHDLKEIVNYCSWFQYIDYKAAKIYYLTTYLLLLTTTLGLYFNVISDCN